MNEDRLYALFKELVGFKHTSPSGTPSTPYMHGPAGLFGVSGLERDIISTRVQPRGLAGVLPAVGTIDTNPQFAYITGFVAASGSNPDTVCENCKTAGPIKNCIQTAQFGRYCFNTREMELNRVGQRTNRGEFLDLNLVNPPLLQAGGNGMTAPNVPGNPDLMRETLVRFMEVGVAFQNQLIPQLYTGNPANNSAGGGYKEFPGLDILIGTSKVDAITGQTCPSLYSDIKDFNYDKVDVNAGFTIVNVLTYMMRQLRWNSERMLMSPTEWVIVMRPGLFYELSAIWPCNYLTYRCANRDTANIDPVGSYSSTDAINMRDSMRNGNFITIDGIQYPVVLDDGIVEDSNTTNARVDNTCFASDIYVVPLRSAGMQVTYWEYLDYSQGAMPAAAEGNISDFYWTDGGKFLWHKQPPLNWCVRWLAKIEPRVILLTPHLAGRITNVQYCPLQHTRDSINTDPYWTDGGVTTRTGPSLYSDWNLGQ